MLDGEVQKPYALFGVQKGPSEGGHKVIMRKGTQFFAIEETKLTLKVVITAIEAIKLLESLSNIETRILYKPILG